ncbi:19954_t:CDS:2 [Rhizophagus irregularis]|nr:19954_t:CDS:2 [Rhizophagus irregularis]
MYSLPRIPHSVNYIKNNSFSNLPTKINNDVFNFIDSNRSSILTKNKVANIGSSGPSNLSVNNTFNTINRNNNGNTSNLPTKNNVFQPVNNSNNGSGGGSSNMSVNNNDYKPTSHVNSSSSPNILEEKSSNIPATKVLEEMYKTLELEIPPVFTFRQEVFTQKFFCSAGFMNKWYDTKEAFPNQEIAREAAAQSLLKIIMASKEYEDYLQEKEKQGNKQSFTPRNTIQKLSRSQRKKLKRQIRMQQKVIGKQDAVQSIFCPNPVSRQENKPKKVKFDDKILVLGQDFIPKPNGSKSLRGIMSQKNQNSSYQYDQISNEPITYQMLVREFLEKDKIYVPPSKFLDDFCIISNISKPNYDFYNDGYGNFIAEILVGDVKYIGERVFCYVEEAQECVAEIAFNILYNKSDRNTKTKFKDRLSFASLDRSLDMPDMLMPDMPSEAAASFGLLQQRHESYIPIYPNCNSSCIQQFGMPPPPPPPPPPLPTTYCNIPMEPSRPMSNTSENPSTFDSSPLTAPLSVSNLGNVQKTRQEIPTQQIQVEPKQSTTVPRQQNDSITPYVLHKLAKERGWGVIDYQYSKTLKGYKCTCYIRKLKFTSNPCIDKDTAKNQAAKIALLALPEYSDCEI